MCMYKIHFLGAWMVKRLHFFSSFCFANEKCKVARSYFIVCTAQNRICTPALVNRHCSLSCGKQAVNQKRPCYVRLIAVVQVAVASAGAVSSEILIRGPWSRTDSSAICSTRILSHHLLPPFVHVRSHTSPRNMLTIIHVRKFYSYLYVWFYFGFREKKDEALVGCL